MSNLRRSLTNPLDINSIGTVNSLLINEPFSSQNISSLGGGFVNQPFNAGNIGSYNSLYGMGGMGMGGMTGAIGTAAIGAMALGATSNMQNPDMMSSGNGAFGFPDNSYNYGQTMNQPAYGQTANQPGYGQTMNQPAYGQTMNQPAYGQTMNQPANTANSQGAYSSANIQSPFASSQNYQGTTNYNNNNYAAPVNTSPVTPAPAPVQTPAPAPVQAPVQAPAPAPVQKQIPELTNTVRKGQKVSLETLGKPEKISAKLGWNSTNGACDVDVSAFLLDNSGKVIGDTWFVFYGQEQSPDGSTVFAMDNGADREKISIDLNKLNPSVSKIVFVLTINEAFEKNLNFSMLKDAYIRIMDDNQNKEIVSFVMDEYYSNVTSMMIGEMYLHNGQWKFNAVGNGVAKDLSGLCELYGVQVV